MAEKCSSCEQMKKENSLARKALLDTNKNYIEVVNENLELRRRIEKLENRYRQYRLEPSPFHGMPLCPHGYQFGCTQCEAGVI